MILIESFRSLLSSLSVAPFVQVLQEMLDMLHEHENQVHAARLEIIVIWLIGMLPLSFFAPHI